VVGGGEGKRRRSRIEIHMLGNRRLQTNYSGKDGKWGAASGEIGSEVARRHQGRDRREKRGGKARSNRSTRKNFVSGRCEGEWGA